MDSVLTTKSEPGMWCKKVEFELDRFIFVAPKPLPEEEWTKLCEKYGEHQTRVLLGDALLIDLRGKEPKFVFSRSGSGMTRRVRHFITEALRVP